MATKPMRTLERYAQHVRATARWIARSLDHGHGGSCAHFSPAAGWSRAYPETSGYLIPTLIALAPHVPELGLQSRAVGLGRWLLSIQNRDGSWNGGLHPPKPGATSSVFNTGQILDGLVALQRAGAGDEFGAAAQRGAAWLTAGQRADGLWDGGDYRASQTPSYYTHVFWPMLEVWRECGDERARAGAERGLATVLARARSNGWFQRSGFTDEERAFTHTIAYTLRGLLECSRLLDAWGDVGARSVPALEVLLRKAELAAGRLPGEFDSDWRATGSYECLTGSAQTAINLLLWEQRASDLRIVNGAARLVDRVCATQNLLHPLSGVRGGVAGSWPLWGRYMTLRYPNWAAKYHCDALLRLTARVQREEARAACASC